MNTTHAVEQVDNIRAYVTTLRASAKDTALKHIAVGVIAAMQGGARQGAAESKVINEYLAKRHVFLVERENPERQKESDYRSACIRAVHYHGTRLLQEAADAEANTQAALAVDADKGVPSDAAEVAAFVLDVAVQRIALQLKAWADDNGNIYGLVAGKRRLLPKLPVINVDAEAKRIAEFEEEQNTSRLESLMQPKDLALAELLEQVKGGVADSPKIREKISFTALEKVLSSIEEIYLSDMPELAEPLAFALTQIVSGKVVGADARMNHLADEHRKLMRKVAKGEKATQGPKGTEKAEEIAA